MGIRDHLERVAAWFGFGVDEDDYYEEEEEGRPYAKDRYRGDAPNDEPGPAVRRLGRTERSSAFGTSLGNLFGSESSSRDRPYGAGGASHLRAVPDQQIPPTRVSVVDPSSFNDAQALADQIQTVANRVFLLTPRNVEVSAEERKRLAERAFFNQL